MSIYKEYGRVYDWKKMITYVESDPRIYWNLRWNEKKNQLESQWKTERKWYKYAESGPAHLASGIKKVYLDYIIEKELLGE